MRRSGGFTLIELVVVITVIGMLSIGAVSFITDASDAYANTVRRAELGSTMRLAAERATREPQNALPNSVRVAAALPTSMPGRGLIGEGLTNAYPPFTIAIATLTEVAIDLEFADALRIHHTVRLRNVP